MVMAANMADSASRARQQSFGVASKLVSQIPCALLFGVLVVPPSLELFED